MSNRSGFEFLESDNEIFNWLASKRGEGDEILSRFSLNFMDESYKNEDMEEVNRIYVVRGRTLKRNMPTTHDGTAYDVQVEVIIRTSKYDAIKGQQLLKTATLCINQYVMLMPNGAYIKLDSITPLYNQNSCLREYRLVFLCTEICEREIYDSLCKDLKVDLRVRASIRGDEEFEKIYPLVDTVTESVPDNGRYNNLDEIEFGGG